MQRATKMVSGLASALVLSLGIAATSAAHMEGKPGKTCAMGSEQAMERMAQRLELSAGQSEQIKAIRAAHGPELQALRERIREHRQAMHQQGQGSFDEAAVQAQAEQLGSLVAQASVLMTRMRSDIQAVLSPEQQARMAQMQQRRGHKGRRHSH